MTVSTTTNKVSYIGNGIATSFAIPFPYLDTSHLKVFQLLNDIRTQRTDWTILDGNLTFETAPATDAQIVIIRTMPFTQETDYLENEVLAAEILEKNFDALTMQIQQLKEQVDRAFTVTLIKSSEVSFPYLDKYVRRPFVRRKSRLFTVFFPTFQNLRFFRSLTHETSSATI